MPKQLSPTSAKNKRTIGFQGASWSLFAMSIYIKWFLYTITQYSYVILMMYIMKYNYCEAENHYIYIYMYVNVCIYIYLKQEIIVDILHIYVASVLHLYTV